MSKSLKNFITIEVSPDESFEPYIQLIPCRKPCAIADVKAKEETFDVCRTLQLIRGGGQS